jgi:hypothetical protein
MSIINFLSKERLNDKFSDRCRLSNSFLNKINDKFEDYIKSNILTYYSGYIQLPITCDNPWLLARGTQNKIIKSVNDFPCNTSLITTCIDIHNEINTEPFKFKSFSDLKLHIKTICTDIKYEKFSISNDNLNLIINYWQNLLFIYKDNKELFNYISGVLDNYYTTKELLGDSYFNPSIEEDDNISPLGYIEVATMKVKERYNIPDIYDNTECRGKCTAMYNKKEPCEECKRENEPSICKNCSNSYKAKYEELCYNCYIDVELEKEKKIWNKKIAMYKKLNNKKFETWISCTHKYTLIGRPCIYFTMLKNQQTNSKTKDILNFLQNLLGNDFIIHLNAKFNKSSCPPINALMYAWKNIDYNYTIKLFNKNNNNDWIPTCKTFVTKTGFPLFDKLKTILEEFEKCPSDYNPYMILEVDNNADKSNNDNAIDWTKTDNPDSTNDYISKVNSIPTPIEENKRLQAIEVFAKYMCDNGHRVNHDGTVWAHNKSTKMTFEQKNDTIDDFFNRVTLRLSEGDAALVEAHKQYVNYALKDSKSDDILYSAIPRMKMSYRMIEFNDGFLDIINRCIYKEQYTIPCYICYNDVKLSSIYEEIESNFIGISQWYKVCMRSGLWYIEYLYNLYSQLQVNMSNRDILIHVGNNYDQLIFLLNPFLKLFPADTINKVMNTINQVEAKKLQSALSPAIFPDSSMKLVKQCLELCEKQVLKCGSIHNSSQSVTDPNSNLKEHIYLNTYLEKSSYKVVKELPYIVIFTALCSNAVINRTQSLYKLPVYENITPSKQEIFNRDCDYLYAVNHVDIDHDDDQEIQTSKAFSYDVIAYQNNTIINNNIVNIPINAQLQIADTQTAKKRRGRPRKEPIDVVKDALPPAYEQ